MPQSEKLGKPLTKASCNSLNRVINHFWDRWRKEYEINSREA